MMSGNPLRIPVAVAAGTLLAMIAWLFLAVPVQLVTADLGRHLQNGLEFFAEGRILTTNFYSYTAPDFPALCHHWGIGPIFYGIWKGWGFQGLSLAYAALLTGTFFLTLGHACRFALGRAVLVTGLLALPLLAYRVEIRPEGISTLLLAIEFFLLAEWRRGSVRTRWLALLPFFQLVWVNVHILFFCGLLLIAVYVLDAFLREGPSARARSLTFAGIASAAGSFINPFVLTGVLQPATIFQGYGYDIAENQNVLFMMKRFPEQGIYSYYLAAVAAVALLLALRVWKEKDWRPSFPHWCLVIIFGFIGAKAVRGMAMAGFVFIPVAAGALSILAGQRLWLRWVLWIGAAAALLVAATQPWSFLSPLRKFRGMNHVTLPGVLAEPAAWSGMPAGMERSAVFFKEAGLKGPVFNNYDIGGYVIFYLFPAERPFVDNRPEAYPVSFFKDVYEPMQEQETVWTAMLQRYGFQVIYFFRHDQTPWAQPFLIRRLQDPAWAPVFADDWTLILARRNGVNQRVIARHELSPEIFRITRSSDGPR